MISADMTSLDLFREASRLLKTKGIEEPEKEVEILFCTLLNIEREELYGKDPLVTEEGEYKIFKAIEERAAGRPLQYIVGFVEFYGLRISVGEGVLIPRPETELIIDEVLSLRRQGYLKEESRILDLCTGSGCIALALARNISDAFIVGTDSSYVALNYAEQNRSYHGLRNVEFLKADLFPERDELFDIIVSNPPYISRDEMDTLQPHVRMEPFEALYGGEDGLDFYRRIMGEAKTYLNEEGFVLLEMGAGQAKNIESLAKKAGFTVSKKTKDLAGVERVIVLRQGVGHRG